MHRTHSKDHENSEINITPMLDVVFILLIFFIVSTSFVKETGLGISRASASPQPQEAGEVVRIKLDPAGHSINGQTVALDGIESRLLQMQAGQPNLQAQLFSAKEVNIATLVKAMEQIESANIRDFSVSSY